MSIRWMNVLSINAVELEEEKKINSKLFTEHRLSKLLFDKAQRIDRSYIINVLKSRNSPSLLVTFRRVLVHSFEKILRHCSFSFGNEFWILNVLWLRLEVSPLIFFHLNKFVERITNVDLHRILLDEEVVDERENRERIFDRERRYLDTVQSIDSKLSNGQISERPKENFEIRKFTKKKF